jgi:hypothetical protein
MAMTLSARLAHAELVFTNTIYNGTNFTIQVSDPVSLPGTPFNAVTLRAVGKNGALPSTFDSDKSGVHGTGITASALHEIWPYDLDVLKTPTLDMGVPINQALDSHFLVHVNDLTIPAGKAPAEDRVLNHAYDSYGGFGTYLKGTFTDSTAVNSIWNFAYLVVPVGTTVNVDFEIGAAGKPSETVMRSFTVPEPSTIVLLSLGFVGFVVCRRRLSR